MNCDIQCITQIAKSSCW